MKYVSVTKSRCSNVQKERAGLAGRHVMGTLQVHAAIIRSVGGVVVKNTTCFCDACFSNCIVEPVCEDGKFTAQSSKRQGTQNTRQTKTNKHNTIPVCVGHHYAQTHTHIT